MTTTTTEASRPAAEQAEPLLELRGVNKSFGPVQVLHDVDLTVRSGHVTALVGDNGAGKSTLIKGIAGIHAFDSGNYVFEGKTVHVHNPKQANALGIRLTNRQNAFAAANLRLFEQARPWLDEDLVEFLFSMPGALRTDNRLTRKMLEMAHPDLAAIPFAQKDSIPQAHTYRQTIPACPALGEFLRAQFNERFDLRLAALFRPGSLTLLIDSLLAGKTYPFPQTHWWQALPGMWRINARRYHGDRIHPVSIMLRLMQINLYLEAMAQDRAPH
jgi:energy-coupling factor transporter ATP-binding protein EcfA2